MNAPSHDGLRFSGLLSTTRPLGLPRVIAALASIPIIVILSAYLLPILLAGWFPDYPGSPALPQFMFRTWFWIAIAMFSGLATTCTAGWIARPRSLVLRLTLALFVMLTGGFLFWPELVEYHYHIGRPALPLVALIVGVVAGTALGRPSR